MLAQTLTSDPFNIPKTGDPTIDGWVAKIVALLLLVSALVTAIAGVWAKITALKDAIFATATAIETSTNGEMEALLRKYIPGLSDVQIKLVAKAAHELITGRIKSANTEAKTETVMNPIVTAAKAQIEEVRKSQVQIAIPKESGRVRSAWVGILAMAWVVVITMLAIHGCGVMDIPDTHLDSDVQFIDAVEEEYFDMLGRTDSLNGVTVTPEILRSRHDLFESVRFEIKTLKNAREKGRN